MQKLSVFGKLRNPLLIRRLISLISKGELFSKRVGKVYFLEFINALDTIYLSGADYLSVCLPIVMISYPLIGAPLEKGDHGRNILIFSC